MGWGAGLRWGELGCGAAPSPARRSPSRCCVARRPQVFSGHSGSVVCGSFTPDGKWVVTGGGEGDASLKVWSPKTGECALTVQVCGAGARPQELAARWLSCWGACLGCRGWCDAPPRSLLLTGGLAALHVVRRATHTTPRA